MFDINNFLFPMPMSEHEYSGIMLAFRVIFGVMIMYHGAQKLKNFSSLKTSFPDPLGIGIKTSLVLAIFGELICPIAFIAGFLYRLCMIPMMFTMFIAFFVAMRKAPYDQKELGLVYLLLFILLYLIGPGEYSIDYLIALRIF